LEGKSWAAPALVRIGREKHAFLYFIASSQLCSNFVIFFFIDSDAVLRWIGSCKKVLKNAVKVASETARNFVSSDMVTLQ